MGLHANCRRIDEVLAGKGFSGRVKMLPQAAPNAKSAAAQLGVEVAQIANSLIFRVADDTPLLVMASGAHRVDTARIVEWVGAEIGRADPEFVRRHTGQPIGGVAPMGHPAPIRTLIDEDLADLGELWAGGGIPHAVFPMSFNELVTLTNGEICRVA